MRSKIAQTNYKKQWSLSIFACSFLLKKLFCSIGVGGLSEVNIPVQELGGQRGEGAYFREGTVIPYSRKFLPGEIFAFVAPCSHGQTFYLAIFLSCTNDIEPMAITTA